MTCLWFRGVIFQLKKFDKVKKESLEESNLNLHSEQSNEEQLKVNEPIALRGALIVEQLWPDS